jgi:potassium channel subfamily K protein
MGSLLFGVWEDWDWLTSAYYCFITITTIGFGDVVPGSGGFQTVADQWKMIAASVYIVFGMAIMSMAFNLIQV